MARLSIEATCFNRGAFESDDRAALFRIAYTKETHARSLDLGDLAIDRLPDEIGELTELRMLSLGRSVPEWFDDGTITWNLIKGRGCSPIKDLSALRNLPHLEALCLRGCDISANFEAVCDVTGLKNLDITGCRTSDIDWLNGLPNFDMRRLNELPCLETLYLDCTAVEDFGPLSDLTSLRRLQISNSHFLRDTEVLRGLKNLEWLNLWACWELADITALSQLPNLRGLVLDQCHSLIDTSPISECTALERLSFCMCLRALERLPDLSQLTALSQLSLSGCYALRDFEGLKRVPNLKWLSFDNNHADLTVLSELKTLRHLFLGGKVDLAPLVELPNLESLIASRVKEGTSLGSLRSLCQLRSLDLSGNRDIQDWSPLGDLRDLELLDVSHSSFNDISIADRLPQLRELDLRGCDLRRPGFLERLASKTHHIVSGLQRKVFGMHIEEQPVRAGSLPIELLSRLSKLGVQDQVYCRDSNSDECAAIDKTFHWL